MSTTLNNPSRLAQPIESLLARVRRGIRSYVWTEGIAVAVAVLGFSFWVTLGFDWVFESPKPFRIVILASVAASLLYVVYRYILRRAFVRLGDRNMAVLLERRFDRFHDSLLTTVELAEKGDLADDFNREMLSHTQSEALASTAGLPLVKVFNMRPLVRKLALAVLLLASIMAFGFWASEAFGIWARRTLLLSTELWPRQTSLTVLGFENGSVKIARGSDLDLFVEADAAPGREVPEVVEVRYTTSDGARGRENMSRDGEVTPAEGARQQYSYKFKGVLTPIDFYVRGGDDRKGPLHLEVVDSPTVSQMTLHCEYPAYMKRVPRQIPVTGLMQVPRGTKVTISAQSNKPLVNVQVDEVAESASPVTHKLELAAGGAARQQFEFAIDSLDADKSLLFTLLDDDGIRSRDGVRLSLSATADDAPQVGVQLKGIGTAITASARLPTVGEVTDDYGIAQLWYDVQVDENPAEKRPLEARPNGVDKLAVDEALEVESFSLKPKQKLRLAIAAADTYALADTPNVGASQHYVLDVVTPEQLRSLLEARELQLRRRFETIIEEFTETRDTLARMELSQATGDSAPADGAVGRPKTAADDKAIEPGDEAEARAAAAAAGDKKSAKSPEQALTQRRVQGERVLQNAQRTAHETLGVATSFDDIRAELVNNRVDTAELKTRLKDGIADPLRQLCAGRLAELEKQLKRLQAALADPAAGLENAAAVAAQREALAEADAILVEMQQVLNKMLELETFNEVLDLLRGIISSQDKINQQTKEKQKQKVRDLLQE